MAGSKILISFLGGIAAGVALTMYFMADDGGEFREKVASKARNIADSVLSKAEEMIDEAQKTTQKR